ncbi:hypothetical protein MAM1_0020d01761 [Mucor ambiguus]|uniref:VPS9 domain-containing protein n=1 Tax=Mucor ambiguus TaxID=91626 RepID=A0A0C9MKG5_9FUNG|nr:hypothetical protein MAM1_0020d01761 [Mucor ambiguus]
MLESILNDAQLSSKAAFSIVLLPPITDNLVLSSSSASPPSSSAHTAFLQSHVVHIPWGLSLFNSSSTRLKLQKKKNYVQHDQNAQLMISMNDTIYEAYGSTIYCDHNKRRVKITHAELLYTLPGNATCTHLLLYIDQPLVDLATTVDDRLVGVDIMMWSYPVTLWFKEMLQKIVPANNNVVHRIDLLVLKFCDTSVYCDTLSSLHECMEDILYEGYDLLESLDVNAIANISLELSIDNLCGAYESYFMDLTYDVAFFKITQLLLPQDKALTSALEDMEHLDFSQIALPASIVDPRRRVHSAIRNFERIGSFRTPAEKLDCLLTTVSELTQDSDSDSLIPLLLITLIRSKVPHLTANLVYMKDYTFERNIKAGKYGYALSTFEGVLEYILDAHPYLSKISRQNQALWSCIKTGDLELFQQYMMDHGDATDVHDVEGNNALMIACFHGQTQMAAELLARSHIQTTTRNDHSKTPLMAAIQSRSMCTIRLLLDNSNSLDYIDSFGNTAVLYASSMNNLDILQAVVQSAHDGQLLDQINRKTGDTALHIAARNGGSMQFISYIMQYMSNSKVARKKKNYAGETFFHVCRNLEYIKHAIRQHSSDINIIVNQVDYLGRSPLMTWAAHGRLDLVEVIIPYARDYSRVDNDGRTVLHLIALHLGRHLTFGNDSLGYIVKRMRRIVNVRDWCHGNTALHIAAETTTLASAQSISNAVAFIKALVNYGADIHAVNLRDEHPVNICRIPELTTCLDGKLCSVLHEHSALITVERPIELHLRKDICYSSIMKHTSLYQYTWAVTRPLIQQCTKGHTSELSYFVKSGQIGKPDTMRIVSRKLQDFAFLRKELLYEMPELFLPTFSQFTDPSTMDLRPPPLAWIDDTLTKLQSFMDWLQYHPILKHHDLVMSFVRSSCDLQKSVIRDNSFSRRKLMLEKIKDIPLTATSMMSSKDEEYFLTYAQEIMMPLKEHYLNMVLEGRHLQHTGLELQRYTMLVAQDTLAAASCLEASDMFTCNTLAVETLRVCANVTFENNYASPWSGLLQVSQMAYAMVDGTLLSLQRPFHLINRRCALRESIELQKEVLRKSKTWHHLFSPKEKKKRIEDSKEKVIQNMNDLNHIDGQIHEAHRLISDELAHFQNIHPVKMMKALKRFARSTLEMERQKLSALQYALERWEEKPLPPIP